MIREDERFHCGSGETGDVTVTVVFQSAGGGHEPDNTLTAGDFCHLEAIHRHHSVRVWPPASNPTWTFGRRQTLFVVEGRERRAVC